MAHLYNLVHGIQDVSNNGYYHNQKFKATAEAHGLHIEKHAKYGWTATTLAPEAEAWIRKTLGEDKINASRLPVEGTTKGGSKKSINRSIKYVCPLLRHHYPGNAGGQCNLRGLRRGFPSGNKKKAGGREVPAKLFSLKEVVLSGSGYFLAFPRFSGIYGAGQGCAKMSRHGIM